MPARITAYFTCGLEQSKVAGQLQHVVRVTSLCRLGAERAGRAGQNARDRYFPQAA